MEKEQYKAGGIVIRQNDQNAVEVFLIHRHRYDDWSFPKGHIDAGETNEIAALREVREETGFECRVLGALPDMHYADPTGTQHHVAWFVMSVTGETGAGLDESEVDGGEWLDLATARERLSYDSSKEYFDAALPGIMDYASAL